MLVAGLTTSVSSPWNSAPVPGLLWGPRQWRTPRGPRSWARLSLVAARQLPSCPKLFQTKTCKSFQKAITRRFWSFPTDQRTASWKPPKCGKLHLRKSTKKNMRTLSSLRNHFLVGFHFKAATCGVPYSRDMPSGPCHWDASHCGRGLRLSCSPSPIPLWLTCFFQP